MASPRFLPAATVETWGPPPHGPNPSWIDNAFADDVWQCTSHEGRPQCLDFLRVPEEFRLNCKYFLWAIEHIHDTRFNTRRTNSTASYRRYFYDYRKFAVYLADRGVRSFADASEKHCLSFVRENWQHSNAPSIGYSTRFGTLFLKLLKLGSKGACAIPDGLLVSVTPERIERFVEHIKPPNETPIIPDIEARRIGNSAIEFIDKADAVCSVYECANSFLDSPLHNPRHNKRAAILAREQFLYSYASRSAVEEAFDRLQPLLPLANDFQPFEPKDYRHCKHGERLVFLSFAVAAHIMQHLVAACFINIALLNGYRSAEILSIGPGDIRLAGVGTVIKTTIHKTSGRAAGVAVDRPGHSSMMRVDHALARAAIAQGSERYWGLGHGGTLMNMVLTRVLNAYVKEVAGVPDWRVTSRQFRRYFAIFYVQRHHGPEDALRRAFRHVTANAIKSYVRDAQNAQYFVEANRRLVRAIYFGLALQEGEYGAPESSPTLRNVRQYLASNLPLEQIDKDIDRRLQLKKAEVRPTVWGYCMLSKNDPLGARCGGESGVPQALEMYPGNCGRCQHLVVGKDHIPWWQNFRSMHEGVIESTSSTIHVKKASAAAARMADDVIGRLKAA